MPGSGPVLALVPCIPCQRYIKIHVLIMVVAHHCFFNLSVLHSYQCMRNVRILEALGYLIMIYRRG